MDDAEIEQNVTDYCRDIKKFVREKDYESAQILVNGLGKFCLDLRRKKL